MEVGDMSDQWDKLLQSIVVFLTVTALAMVVVLLFIPAETSQRVERVILSQFEKGHQTAENSGTVPRSVGYAPSQNAPPSDFESIRSRQP